MINDEFEIDDKERDRQKWMKKKKKKKNHKRSRKIKENFDEFEIPDEDDFEIDEW